MAKNLFSEVNIITERRFDFEDYQRMKGVFLDYMKKKQDHKIYLLISKNVATFGFWLVPFNFPVAPEIDLVFKGKEITDLFSRIDKEIELNPKQKRVYMITLDYACAAIITVNGLITNEAPIFKWMFGKTLQEIKPWLREKKVIKVEEITEI